MADDSRVEGPTLSAAALSEWSQHVDSVLRGIAHALNNRAAALSAVIELSQEPAEEPSVTNSILATELERVRALTAAIRSIGAPKSGAEAFAPGDAATEAHAVLELHAEQRDRAVSFQASSAPPIRMPRWMYVRALIVMAASASRAVHTRATVVTVVGEDEWVVARVDDAGTPLSLAPPGAPGAPGVTSTDLTPYVTELTRAMGGEPLRGRYGFRVPTLEALRRREER